ncbi:MAG: 4Fe-4S binding protein [Erysipelotrichaceae bacterium]|nr:4Fe-4S binding protein [Erysipelotrichaceae bacterium]
MNYLDILVNDIHSTVIATVDNDNKPVTRVIDMMLYDDQGVYFLTAKGKEFYKQLMEQKYISLSATKDKISISLRGYVENIGYDKLDAMFDKNEYMKEIYPNDTRKALQVFRLYEASGEYFDISDPSHVTRDSITIGDTTQKIHGYFVGKDCIGCKLCYSVCPQKCIDISRKPVVIDQNHCSHCGRCVEICPKQTIEKRF